MMSKRSREKGKRLEREAAALWRDAGWPCSRSAQHKGGPESPDVVPVEEFWSFDSDPLDADGSILIRRPISVHCEVKGGKNTPAIYDAMAQAVRDQKGENMPVVMVKKDRHDWLMVLRPDNFFQLLREWL